MAFVTVNDRPAIEAHISIPRVGIWHADVFLDGGEEVAGPVTIKFPDNIQFRGTVIRQAVYADYLRLRAVAGGGRMYKTLVQPKQWSSGPIPLSVVLNDILGQSGEQLSRKTDQALLNTPLPSWTCIPQSAPAAVRSLLSGVANSWRMLEDGTFWAGPELWKDVTGTFGHTLIHQRTDIGVMEIAEDSSYLRPGSTFRGFRVSRVDNYIGQNAPFRTTVHYFDAPT